MARAALPVAADVPLKGTRPSRSAPATLVDVRSCGADAGGRGRLLTAWSTGGAAAVPALRGADDCKAAAAALAERARAAAPEQPVVVAELAVAFRPDGLSLSVEKAALAGDASASRAEGLRALVDRPALGPLPTSAFAIGVGAGQLLLSLSGQWQAAGVAVTVVQGARAAAPTGGPTAAPREGLAGELPLSLLNTMVAVVARHEPLRIRVDPEEIELSDVRIARGGGGLVVTGRATPRSVPQSFDVAVDLGGGDLQIVDVRVDAGLEDCTSQGLVERIACNARNAGRGTAAQALAAGLRRQYRGRLVRELVGAQEVPLAWAGRHVRLRLDLLRLAAAPAGVRAEATATAAPAAPSPPP